jgi:hypothetical protein
MSIKGAGCHFPLHYAAKDPAAQVTSVKVV